MHARTKPRTDPYVWATWISKLLAGESSCVWSAWFRAHHHVGAKVETDFDLELWRVEHTALIRRTAADFASLGYTVTVESQNQFTLAGRLGTLAGRPDLVAVKGDEGWIIDGKTGQPKGSDRVQVMLYMWALQKANPAYAGVRFRGRVEYKARYGIIDPGEADTAFVTRVAGLMREVCGPNEPRKAPSYRECQSCPLTPDDCGDRVDTEAIFAGVTEEF
ncbi:MAG: PD-(D/E)XK nuclease family protein [Planctomycetes bacterium]|nr:PD-(D/E)XK nuclease family protein [Planctomycetota bacterium]